MNPRRPLVIVALGALVLRLLLLLARGDYIIYDEGYYLLLARSMRAGHGFTLNGLPHVALSPLQPLLVAIVSLAGIPDLWASRLIAAVSGAALVFPVAWLARRWGGGGGGSAAWRAGVCAAVLVATAPALLSFAPFAPHTWNLYFGSEPLFLFLAASALVAVVRAVDGGGIGWWAAFGALGALAYLARLEGAVLAVAAGVTAVLLVLLHPAHRATRARALAGAGIAIVTGAVVAAPYFLYLHGALGRWAVSGRVQAAGAPAASAASAATPPAAGAADPLQAFVWGGNREALWSALYALDGSGRWMASQYWGVVPRSAHGAPAAAPAPGAISAPNAAPAAADSSARAMPPRPVQLARAILTIVPWWLIVLGLGGLALVRPRRDALPWLAAIAVTTLVPALFAYVEPRALLLLVPAAAILGGITLVWIAGRLPPRAVHPVALAIVAGLLAGPVVDVVRAWPETTPLQQAASGRRAVGEFLGEHLPQGARIVSWHPAVAIWAHRDWRVLPFADLPRIMGYARAQHADAVVLSSFEPSPLRNPPRAFTVILVDTASAQGADIRLEQVAATPLLFVGRIAPAQAARP